MKKSLIIGSILIMSMVAYFAYQNYADRTIEKRESLIAACNGLEFGESKIDELNVLFADYYSENLTSTGTTSRKLFGMSKSKFSTFCVVTYTDEGTVVSGGVSYD